MASSKLSSSSSISCIPNRGWIYDVFLSFRGEDTRNTFVDHLYATLVHKGIHVFKDDKMLGGGKPISFELLKAIQDSRFAVVVFSKNYANSSWCLDELAKIMECKDQMGQKVLPVFYHVDPSDVRRQKTDYATAFQQHEEKFSREMDKVNKWREALTSAANLSGYHISPVSGSESAIIDKIVQEIFGNIQPRSRENNLIGIESHMDALYSLLSMETTKEVCIIGILGMGGIGKTTITKALFRRIAYMFEGTSFVNDVRENSSNKKGICTLQEKILKDILGGHHGFQIQDPEDGADMIQERLCKKKVLLALDDVDNVNQLEFLAATHDWFGPGSRIIITTRDEHVLSDANAKYKPALLHMDHAVELFSRYAFRKKNPPEGYMDLSNRAIHYTGRLPLALKVLGSFLRGRQAKVWESALDRLAKTLNCEIFETLRLSFDGLEESEKKIFLDIVCFYKGREIKDVTRVLDSNSLDPAIGVSSLIEKSLITVSSQRLYMHDLVRAMGLQIVRETAPNSRLWQIEQIHDFINRNRELGEIEAIVVVWQGEKEGLSVDIFENMKNLRLLDVYGEFTTFVPTFLPNELRWLRWVMYPFSSLPFSDMRKLAGLEIVSGNIKHLWEGEKIMLSLKYINLQSCYELTRFPDVSGAPNVERLILSRCLHLVEVDESLGLLKRLVYLDMSYCFELKCLPSRIEMESLDTLIIFSCSSLPRFPEFSPSMVKLSYIDFSHCSGVEQLPLSVEYLSNLTFLNTSYCTNLQNIPKSIYELKFLKTLRIDGCSKLQNLPNEFGSMEKLEELYIGSVKPVNFHALTNLCSLRKLDLSWTQIGEEEFPKNLHGLSALEELNLSRNSKLVQLPASISHLSRLKQLELNWCSSLQILHGLPSGLQVLYATKCSSLEKIEDLSKEYKMLYNIGLLDCKKLQKDGLGEMLEKCFLEKWAAIDNCMTIGIPGNNIPGWFKEQQHGAKIALKLPPKWQTEIMGVAVCGVFKYGLVANSIYLRFGNDGICVPESHSDNINASATAATEDRNVWIAYIPFPFIWDLRNRDDDDFQREDWFHIVEGYLFITVTSSSGEGAVRCGAEVVYKQDVESIQQIQRLSTSSNYWNWEFSHYLNTIRCLDPHTAIRYPNH